MNNSKVQLKGGEARNRMYRLCNARQYFTCGSPKQYEKFFDLVERAVHLEIIATTLWLCFSDNFDYGTIYRDCYETLMVEEN